MEQESLKDQGGQVHWAVTVSVVPQHLPIDLASQPDRQGLTAGGLSQSQAFDAETLSQPRGLGDC